MNVETILTATLGVIVALGLVAAYFWQGRGGAVIKLQAANIDALNTKIKIIQDDSIAKDAKIAALEATIKSKDEQITTIRDLTQISPQLKALVEAIQIQSRTINDKLTRKRNTE